MAFRGPRARTLACALSVAAVLSLSAPAAADLSPEAIRAGHLAEVTLDDPISAYTPGSSLQSVVAQVQTLGTQVSQMRIPSIGLEDDVLAGVSLDVLDNGPGHWVGTASPGEAGNMVIAGHRTTYGAPFGNLDMLNPGDMMYFTAGDGREVMYKVTETLIVNPEDIWITYETGKSIATLFACHPKGSARHRIVVRAALVGDGKIF